jgi:hypothetical protein
LEFLFQEDIPIAVRHSVAEDFFLKLTSASGRDSIEFLMNALVLFRDLPNSYIRYIDMRIERVSDEDTIVIPAGKDCGKFIQLLSSYPASESDNEVEDLLAGHVQTVLEYAYPNSLNFNAIVEALRSTPELVTSFLNELVGKGIVEQLESGEYIRVNNFASK